MKGRIGGREEERGGAPNQICSMLHGYYCCNLIDLMRLFLCYVYYYYYTVAPVKLQISVKLFVESCFVLGSYDGYLMSQIVGCILCRTASGVLLMLAVRIGYIVQTSIIWFSFVDVAIMQRFVICSFVFAKSRCHKYLKCNYHNTTALCSDATTVAFQPSKRRGKPQTFR